MIAARSIQGVLGALIGDQLPRRLRSELHTPLNVYSDEAIANQLADNGGRTQTMSIPSSSAAVGFANLCPKRDQRGRLRPADCDSGAFENKPRQG